MKLTFVTKAYREPNHRTNNMIQKLLVLLLVLSAFTACQPAPDEVASREVTKLPDPAQEKAAIINVLNNETKAAFNRDYQAWQDKWLHDPDITKTYMDLADSTMTETIGWAEINDFVKTYLEEHPEPEPLPTMVDDINVRLYGSGAWVSYEQNDADQGLKRETRLMEKVDGVWKIAGMHTTIYGFGKEE